MDGNVYSNPYFVYIKMILQDAVTSQFDEIRDYFVPGYKVCFPNQLCL